MPYAYYDDLILEETNIMVMVGHPGNPAPVYKTVYKIASKNHDPNYIVPEMLDDGTTYETPELPALYQHFEMQVYDLEGNMSKTALVVFIRL